MSIRILDAGGRIRVTGAANGDSDAPRGNYPLLIRWNNGFPTATLEAALITFPFNHANVIINNPDLITFEYKWIEDAHARSITTSAMCWPFETWSSLNGMGHVDKNNIVAFEVPYDVSPSTDGLWLKVIKGPDPPRSAFVEKPATTITITNQKATIEANVSPESQTYSGQGSTQRLAWGTPDAQPNVVNLLAGGRVEFLRAISVAVSDNGEGDMWFVVDNHALHYIEIIPSGGASEGEVGSKLPTTSVSAYTYHGMSAEYHGHPSRRAFRFQKDNPIKYVIKVYPRVGAV